MNLCATEWRRWVELEGDPMRDSMACPHWINLRVARQTREQSGTGAAQVPRRFWNCAVFRPPGPNRLISPNTFSHNRKV